MRYGKIAITNIMTFSSVSLSELPGYFNLRSCEYVQYNISTVMSIDYHSAETETSKKKMYKNTHSMNKNSMQNRSKRRTTCCRMDVIFVVVRLHSIRLYRRIAQETRGFHSRVFIAVQT